MKKEYAFPAGTRFVFDTEKKTLTLASLCGMTCGHNESEYVYSNSGLAVICVDERRLEGEKLQYKVGSVSETGFTYSAVDEKKTVKWKSRWTFEPEFGLISCVNTLSNTSKKPLTVRRALPRWVFTPGDYEVYSLLNRWAAENIVQKQPLRSGDIYLHGRPARSTSISSPFCILKDVENRAAAAFHVLPRGNWTIQIHSDVMGSEATAPVVEAGLADNDLFLPLAPGETLELPEVLVEEVPQGDPLLAGAPLHRYMIAKRLPKLHLPPMLYNCWLYRFTDFTVDQLREQLKAAKEIGCEVFIVDAGWFGLGPGWSQVGDWREKEGAPFYGNMAAFADEVRAAGLKFGFWMEPERFIPGVPIRKEHPEWFPGHSFRIDLTQPAAADYFYEVIAKNVRKFGAEYLKIDFNNTNIGYDESGAELYNYCTVLRKQLIRLRKTFPNLVIENCGSGSLRCDLNTATLYDTAFISDNANPFETLRIRQGFFMRFIPGRILNWLVMRPAPERRTPVTKLDMVLACSAATWEEAAQFNLDYVMISGLLGIPGFSGDLAGFDHEMRKKIAAYVKFYKENRGFITDSHVFLLTPTDSVMSDYENFIAFQMQGNGSSDSLLFVFSNGSTRRAVRNFKLHGLDPEKQYEVVKLFDQEAAETVQSGAELMHYGVRTTQPGSVHIRHTAVLYRIREVEKARPARRAKPQKKAGAK